MIFINGLKGLLTLDEAKKLSGYSLHISSVNQKKNKFKIDNVTKTVTVFINSLSAKELATFEKAIRIAFAKDLVYLIEESKVNLLERLYKFNDKESNQILTFFKPILSRFDWEALRDSLFLRSEFNNHGNINGLKTDLFTRYGERGNTISNLCTAGYFEETMIPLFNFSKDEFWEYYDIAIDRGITALFVNNTMTVEKIQSEIKHRLKSAKAYGLKYIHIHGIGKKNIANIRKCIEKEKGNIKFTEKIVFTNPGQQVMVVEIIL